MKGGVHIDGPKQRFCILSAMEAFADEQPWLVLLVYFDHLVERPIGCRSPRQSERLGGATPAADASVPIPEAWLARIVVVAL
jgi:hypothetical protein